MNNPIIKEIMKCEFIKILNLYPNAIQLKASSKKKLDDQQFLLNSDRWIQNKLCSLVHVRKEPHITKEELGDIMKWKLSRGKWRPRLLQLAESNAADSVKEVSNQAIKLGRLNKIENAIQKLCELNGVGPASASAILSICVPENFGFFADEVAEVILHGKPSYTLQEYMQINEELVTISDYLNKKASTDQREWNPHKVELAIWTYCIIKENNPVLLTSSG